MARYIYYIASLRDMHDFKVTATQFYNNYSTTLLWGVNVDSE